MKKVAIIMGSDSDLPVVTPAIKQLKELEIETEVRVMSAHRTPEAAHEFSKNAIACSLSDVSFFMWCMLSSAC